MYIFSGPLHISTYMSQSYLPQTLHVQKWIIHSISFNPHQICLSYVLPAQRMLSSSTQLYKPETQTLSLFLYPPISAYHEVLESQSLIYYKVILFLLTTLTQVNINYCLHYCILLKGPLIPLPLILHSYARVIFLSWFILRNLSSQQLTAPP